MKMLFITERVDKNDAILGFTHAWISEFSKHVENLTVICLEKGDFSLPQNVSVFSLGKEKKVGRFLYLLRFYNFIWQERKKYNVVFVHMSPIYVVLAGILWQLWKKKIALWYTHRHVDLKLRIAEKFSDIIFTASPESFKLKSKKVHVVGHGIDISHFSKENHIFKKDESLPLSLLHVGRITPIKHCETLIETAHILKREWNRKFQIYFIGEPVTKTDGDYFTKMKKMVKDLSLEDVIFFLGSVPNARMAERYAKADATVNVTPTGGVDKAVLESLASRVPVFSSNQTFKDYFGPYAPIFLFGEEDSSDLSGKIMSFFCRTDVEKITEYLLEVVQKRSSLEALVVTILSQLKQI